MVKVALDAFAARNVEQAETLVDLDELIDRANRRFVQHVLSFGRDPKLHEWGLRMILVSRCFERIGDHAVDIGERVGVHGLGRVPRVHGRLASGQLETAISVSGQRAAPRLRSPPPVLREPPRRGARAVRTSGRGERHDAESSPARSADARLDPAGVRAREGAGGRRRHRQRHRPQRRHVEAEGAGRRERRAPPSSRRAGSRHSRRTRRRRSARRSSGTRAAATRWSATACSRCGP